MRWSESALRPGTAFVLWILPTLAHGAITASEFLKLPAAAASTRCQYEETLSGFRSFFESPPTIRFCFATSVSPTATSANILKPSRHSEALWRCQMLQKCTFFAGYLTSLRARVDSALETFDTTASLAAESEYGVRGGEYLPAIDRQRADPEPSRFTQPCAMRRRGDPMTIPQINFPCPVRRIRVLWRKGKWSIQKEIEIPRMTLPKSSELPSARQRQRITGFWYEATDADGQVFYRRITAAPSLGEVELFEEDSTFTRARMEQPEVIFDVLIPDLPEVSEVRFFNETGAEPVAVLKIRGRQRGGKKNGNQ
jgi:hypothetical protein